MLARVSDPSTLTCCAACWCVAHLLAALLHFITQGAWTLNHRPKPLRAGACRGAGRARLARAAKVPAQRGRALGGGLAGAAPRHLWAPRAAAPAGKLGQKPWVGLEQGSQHVMCGAPRTAAPAGYVGAELNTAARCLGLWHVCWHAPRLCAGQAAYCSAAKWCRPGCVRLPAGRLCIGLGLCQSSTRWHRFSGFEG